jgi:GNAT superfamily N-acetyltransferase
MIETVKIRKAIPDDASHLSDLICENADLLLKPYYTELQWNVFIQYYSVAVMFKKIETQSIFCAEIDGMIVGTIALDADFVVGFYTKTSHLKKGIGKKMMQHLEQYALGNGIKTLQLAASPIGVDFYLKNGWEKIKDFNIKYLGVEFEETLMKKQL